MHAENIEKLAAEIHAVVARGFVISPAHLHFLESTFSISTDDHITELLTCGNDDDRELFLELIVSPDDPIHLQLEPAIQAHPILMDDEEQLTEILTKRVQTIQISHGKEEHKITVAVPPYIIERFVTKLGLCHQIPAEILTQMEESLTSDLKTHACVRLRQSFFTYTHGNMEFLIQFIRKFGYMDTDFLRFLEYVLPVLSSSAKDSDMTAIRDLFIRKLALCRKILSQIRTSTDMLKSNTMESLMLQGVFIPPVSEEETIDRLSMITEVLFRIFGWNESRQESCSDIDLGSHDGRESVHEIIKLLS